VHSTLALHIGIGQPSKGRDNVVNGPTHLLERSAVPGATEVSTDAVRRRASLLSWITTTVVVVIIAALNSFVNYGLSMRIRARLQLYSRLTKLAYNFEHNHHPLVRFLANFFFPSSISSLPSFLANSRSLSNTLLTLELIIIPYF
jgi:hypothetical protein